MPKQRGFAGKSHQVPRERLMSDRYGCGSPALPPPLLNLWGRFASAKCGSASIYPTVNLCDE